MAETHDSSEPRRDTTEHCTAPAPATVTSTLSACLLPISIHPTNYQSLLSIHPSSTYQPTHTATHFHIVPTGKEKEYGLLTNNAPPPPRTKRLHELSQRSPPAPRSRRRRRPPPLGSSIKRCSGDALREYAYSSLPTYIPFLTHQLTSSKMLLDGLWTLSIQIPPTYPLTPPKITFKTKISHPNISFTTGEICLTLLTTEHWSPVYTLSSTLSAIHQLLTDPRPDSPLNVDVAALLRDGDVAAWESLVRFWTEEERATL